MSVRERGRKNSLKHRTPIYNKRPIADLPIFQKIQMKYNLTNSEVDVLILMYLGKSLQEIGDFRLTKRKAIKYHVTSIYKKLGLNRYVVPVRKRVLLYKKLQKDNLFKQHVRLLMRDSNVLAYIRQEDN